MPFFYNDPSNAFNETKGNATIQYMQGRYPTLPKGALSFPDYLKANDPGLNTGAMGKNAQWYMDNYQKYVDNYKAPNDPSQFDFGNIYNTAQEGNNKLYAQAEQAYSPDKIKALYSLLAGRLGNTQANTVASAGHTAAVQSSGRNMLNKGAFTSNVMNQASVPFADAFNNLGISEAQTQQGALGKLLGIKQGGQNQMLALAQWINENKFNREMSQETLALKKQQLAMQQQQWQEQMDMNSPNFWNVMSSLTPLLGYALGGK